MKIVHIPVTTTAKVTFPKPFLAKLPKTLGLFTTAQFTSTLPDMKKQLESVGKKVTLFQTRHTPIPGQLLGCNIQKFSGVQAYVYVGDGLFHPKALSLANKIPVFMYNPFNKKDALISQKDAEKDERRRYTCYALFQKAKNVGVFITVKPGQYGIELEKKHALHGIDRYLSLNKKYPDKNVYYLVGNTISLPDLVNYPFLDFVINTACPRIAEDDYSSCEKPILNLEDIERTGGHP
jgi:2-(3-amino-3-carboxypropyl)histidine synthase